jgi:hypothetical protein
VEEPTMKVQKLTKVKDNKECYDVRVKNDKESKRANGIMQQKAEGTKLCHVFVHLQH